MIFFAGVTGGADEKKSTNLGCFIKAVQIIIAPSLIDLPLLFLKWSDPFF